MLRQPIIVVLGHVDHGKTSLLDKIRQTAVTAKEAGGITQEIGTTEIPTDVIKKICGNLLDKFRIDISIPGLLFIDTPGHEAFTTLRKRGGSIADIAIVVIDINEGIMPQTIESLNILRDSKTPFIIALNKIDRLQGWAESATICCFCDNIENQSEDVKGDFEKIFYEITESLESKGFAAERFDRIKDFRKQISVIPTSGKTGEGIPELLAILAGLAQQFLKDTLVTTKHAKGSVLEVKEVVGLGTTIDTVIYDGTVHKGNYLVSDNTVTKIRALMEPAPLRDMRTEKKFQSVDEVSAAAGVKIVAPGLESIVAGSEIRIAGSEQEAVQLQKELQKEKEEVEVKTEKEGLILKAGTIGSLEALINIFRQHPIREATLGKISKEDVIKAEANADPLFRIVIGFNVHLLEEAETFAKNKKIRIMMSDVIYRLIEAYDKWAGEEKEAALMKGLEKVTRPGKLKLLPGCVFRASNPAIVGCEVLGGIIKPGYKLFIASKTVGTVKQIQSEGENLEEATISDKVAVSIDGPTIGRQVNESDTLYTDISGSEYKKLREHEKFLTEHEKTVLKEIEELKRKNDPMWGY